MNEYLKPCPFCGAELDISDDVDIVYPNGSGWKIRPDGFKSYHSFRDVPKEQWCYLVNCNTLAGGCGAEVHGDSRQEAVQKWNMRNGKVNQTTA